LHDNTFHPDTQAVVENWPESYPTSFRNGEVLKEDYSDPDRVILQVKTKENGFLVLADTWYPGWEAYIDGQRTEIFVTNGVQRGIYIEGAGTHEVEFRFVSKSFLAGVATSLATLLLFAGLTIYLSRRDKTHPTPQPAEK